MDSLHLTTKMLQVNPEFYTVWNYRRNIYLNAVFPNSTPEQVNEILEKDLVMTTIALKAHPKVYCIWTHRRWCLGQTPEGPGGEVGDLYGWRMKNWKQELFVVEKMLSVDARNCERTGDHSLTNFTHQPRSKFMRGTTVDMSWQAYRLRNPMSKNSHIPQRRYRPTFPTLARGINGQKSIPSCGKITFLTTKGPGKRVRLIILLYLPEVTRNSLGCCVLEFELVRNAMYTDPGDQSVWVYHRWLVGSGRHDPLSE